MSEEIIIKHCSPTLAGIKTANAFTYKYENFEQLQQSIRNFNRILSVKGIRVIPLHYKNKSVLIYVYRPSLLNRDLSDKKACNMLKQRGYVYQNPQLCITQLIKKLAENGEFPHEIGLFLGYPPEDVQAFIQNGAKNCKVCGCWKSYSDPNSAQKTFDRYKKCSKTYYSLFKQGKSVCQLSVKS